MMGKYILLVGDSFAGKTILAMTCFAEATINRRFRKHRLIYDNHEDGCLMDLAHLFNQAVMDRVEPPSQTKTGEAIYSHTAEQFYYHLDDAGQRGEPFIYILDSMDSLDSDAADEKFGKHKAAFRKRQKKADGEDIEVKKVAGSYGDGKAKINSTSLRRVLNGLRQTNSILIILAQTRDNIGSMFGGQTRGGGRALRFYATLEIWLSIRETLTRVVRGKKRKVGVKVRMRLQKNRLTGELADIEADIYPSHGIDDLGSCVDFLLEEEWWEKQKQSIVATELGITATRDKLIARIEEQNLIPELKAVVATCWKEIQDGKKLVRQNKYALDSD